MGYDVYKHSMDYGNVKKGDHVISTRRSTSSSCAMFYDYICFLRASALQIHVIITHTPILPTRVYLSISTHVYIVWGQKPTFMKLQDQLIHSLGCKQGLLATTCESQVVTDWNDWSIGDLRTNCCFVIRKEILISKLVAACFQLSVYGLNVKLERDVVCGNILPILYSKC